MSDKYDEILEAARRFYWNGSLDGGLGRDTDDAEARSEMVKSDLKRMADFAAALVRREVEAEREACAVLVDDINWSEAARDVAAAIRARGGAKEQGS